jgi:hypothetical protein
LLHQLRDHVAKDGTNCVESFIRCADIVQAMIVEQDFLDNEYGDRLAELGAGFHDSEAKRNDLGCQKEVYDIGGIVLDKSSNDAKRG